MILVVGDCGAHLRRRISLLLDLPSLPLRMKKGPSAPSITWPLACGSGFTPRVRQDVRRKAQSVVLEIAIGCKCLFPCDLCDTPERIRTPNLRFRSSLVAASSPFTKGQITLFCTCNHVPASLPPDLQKAFGSPMPVRHPLGKRTVHRGAPRMGRPRRSG